MVVIFNRFWKRARAVFTRFALLALLGRLEAHRLDEYLQAALVGIKPNAVDIRLYLTPGMDLAEVVLHLIDQNRDGEISAKERTAYARKVVQQLSVKLDARPLELRLQRTECDPVAALQQGTGNILVELRADFPSLSAGRHTLSFENRHHPDISVYLVNALLPKDPSINILKQQRNENQSIAQIYFVVATR